jgi:membrane protease YdiL (CAAX protease family)
LTRAWLLAVLLVVFGNAMPPLIGSTARLPGGSWAFIVAGALLVGVSIAISRDAGLGWTDLGIVGPLRYGALGAALGAAVALVAVLAIPLAAAITGRTLTYEPLRGLPAAALAAHVAFFLPLGDILPEEIAFRGALLGLLARASRRAAIVGGGVAFALWHTAVIVVTVADTTLGPPSPWFVPAILCALLVVFVGGALFAALRLRTGTIATTIGAHWAFNAVVLLGFWWQMPALPPAP